MKKFKSDEQEEKKFKRRTGIFIVIATIIIVSLVYNAIFPTMLIGIIWDYDIRSQLEYQNQQGIETNADEVRFRLTYENNNDTDQRIDRAINVYREVFNYNPENIYQIEKNENVTTLEFIWQVQREN